MEILLLVIGKDAHEARGSCPTMLLTFFNLEIVPWLHALVCPRYEDQCELSTGDVIGRAAKTLTGRKPCFELTELAKPLLSCDTGVCSKSGNCLVRPSGYM